MTYGVQLPDGRTIGFDESTPLETAQQIVRRDFPEAFQKKSGVGAEFKEGLASLIGSSKTALTAPFDPKEAAKRGLLEEQARGAEFESGVSLDKLKKAYADYGLLGGAGELTRQIPLAVSGQLPQLGTSLAGARLGAMAGSAIMPGAGTIIGGGLGALASSFAPQAGQFITRQAQEQEATGQPIDPNLAKAYGYALPAAGIDVAANYFTLGKGLVGKILGRSEEQIAAGVAKNAAKYEADLVKAAEAKLIPTVAKGGARGLTEIPGEVAQQILERAQAGLPLFTEDAIKEYGESAYQAGLVGPAFGAIASPIDRAGSRGELDTLRAQQRATQRKEELAKETEYKASPEYITELTTRRDEIQEELGVLKNILKTKPTDEEDKQARRELKARKRDLDLEMYGIVSNLREATPEDKGLPLTSQQLIDRERNRLDEAATLKQLKATDSRAADDYAKYIKAQDVYQAMQDKEAQRQLSVQEKARQKEAKAIIDAHNQSVKGIGKTADAVTDEFGNIVPGLTKQGALAGRELSVEQRIKLEEYDNALKALNHKLAASGGIKRQNLYDKTYVSDNADLEEIDRLKQDISDKYEGIKDFAGERKSPPPPESTVDKIIAQVSKPEPEPAELTPEQKEAQTKRLADLQKYKQNFNDAVAYYQKLLDEAEETAQQPRAKGKRGQELFAEAKEGRSLEVLKKGQELQAALDAQNKAKGELIEFLEYPDVELAQQEIKQFEAKLKKAKTPEEAEALQNTIAKLQAKIPALTKKAAEFKGTVVTPLEASDALKDVALLDLTDTIDSMRKGEFFGGPNPEMATGSAATKAIKARKELDRYIKIVINSINAEREAKNLGKLSEKSVNEIQDKFLELFGGKIARATGKKARVLKAAGEKAPEDTTLRRAFEAAGFKFKELPKGEGEIKTGFSRAEFADVKDFTQDIHDEFVAKDRTFGKLTRETTGDLFEQGRLQDTGKARKTEGAATDIEQTARLLDKVLDADLTGAERSVFERAETLLAEGKRTKDTESTTASGTKNVIPGLIDAVNAQGNRVLAGLEPDLKDIREAIKRVEETFATPVQTQPSGKPATQLEFFPGETATIRANQENFSRLLSVQRRKGSAVISAARKWLNGFKTIPPYSETARSFFKVIVDLESDAAKLKRERDALDPAKVTDYATKVNGFNKKIVEIEAKLPQANKDFNYHRRKSEAYVAGQFAKLFDNRQIWELLKEATKLDAEGAKLLRKGKNKYRAEANQAFEMADEFRKEAYDVYTAAEKDVLKKIEKLDKPTEILAQFEAQKKKIENSLKETLAKQAKEQVERNMPEYPERIKMLRLQNKTISAAIKSVKERVAEEQAEASRKIGLGLPGTRSTIPVQAKMTAMLPHRYDAVQSPFSFARTYFKEMMGRRSVTMNKKQVEAYQQASAKYKESRTKLNKALKENNVDARIATIMNSMVEMDDSTSAYRKLENNILGIEDLLEQKVLGTQAKNVITPIEVLTPKDFVTDKDLGYTVPELVKDEDFVGRISEADLAAMRKKQNDEFEAAKKRLYGLSLQGETKRAATETERSALATQIAQLEKDIKATDVILSARRVGMAVGKAQEEMGAKRFKPSETEKAMTKAGKFEKAGVAPEYYATVAQAFKSRKNYAESRKAKADKQTPDYVKKIIKQIAALDTRLNYDVFENQYRYEEKTGKKILSADVDRQKKDLQEEIDELKKDLSIAVTRIKREDWAKAFNAAEGTNFRTKTGKVGGIDPVAADGFINNMLKKQGFNPTRRAVTGAIGAFMLPIKIPSIAGINADFKQMIARNAMSGLGLNVKDDTAFDDAFVERHGGYWPDAMGDLEFKANNITGGVISLVNNTYDSIAKNDTFKDGIDKAVVFQETFDDKIFASLRKLYKPFADAEYGRHYANNQTDFKEYIDEMLSHDRGQMGDEWQNAHNALYVNDPTEYAALVTEAYTSALRAAGVNPQKAVEQIDNAKAKTVVLASGVKFVYAKDISQAPDAFINAAIAANKDLLTVQGGVMPDGTVVVIGNTHTDVADLEETIAHEIIGHYSVDTMLGLDGLKALAKKVFSAGDAGAYQLAAELGVYSDAAEAFAAAKMNNMSAEEMQLLVTREMVAHVAERPISSKASQASQALKDFIKMLVNAIRKFFTGAGLEHMAEATTQDIYNLVRKATKEYESGRIGAYMSPNGDVVFKGPNRYGNTVSQSSINTFEKMYVKKQTLFDKFLANFTGMSGRMQWLDNLAGFEQILNKAEENKQITSEDALKANYYMRLYGQRLNLTAQFATNGVSKVEKNSAGELDLIERPDAANLINVSTILERAKALGNSKVINQFFQTYLVAKRVERVGLRALNVDLDITEQDLKRVKADIEKAGVEGIFKEAATEYAKYNKSLIEFAVKMGAIPKEEGARLTRYDDYVPFYRVNSDGAAELLIAGERPIRIGDMATQPYLHELVGGKEGLVDFETSAFQNTGVLVDLAMRTMATTTLMDQLSKIGGKDRIAVRVNVKAKGTNIIHGKVDGYEAAWKLDTTDTGFEDIPADLLVKGLEGIKTTLPAIVKGMGLPARFLRTMITRTPTYLVNQIAKDSTAMWMYSGADITPGISALKELGTMLTGKNAAEKELQASGIEGGQVFTGMPEDQAKAFLQIMGGKNTMQSLFVKADRLAMKADAATRVAMYNAYIKKGMSPMRAKLTVLEALNYNKRGLSPTVNMLATVIPFMNTQIQGLDVLVKAFRGKLTLGQQKDLRAKLWRRGMALSMFTIAYAALMSDDEAYKNADPFTKYTSWFIRVPFFDEPLRIPAPFEFGYVFKAIPEAIYGLAFKDEKLSNFGKFATQAAINSIPVGLPQAIKPAIEAYSGTSFYTGQGIESAREKSMLPGFRERNNTTEVSKLIASMAPEHLSPVMLDHLARAYGGSLTVAMASVLNPFLAPTSDIVAPEKSASQLPLIGGFFQPNDAPGVINAAYEISNRAQQASKSFNDLINSGQKEKALAVLNKFKSEIVMQESAGSFVREMGELSALERLLARGNVPNMSAKEKADKLKEVRAAKIKLAEMFNQTNKTISERV